MAEVVVDDGVDAEFLKEMEKPADKGNGEENENHDSSSSSSDSEATDHHRHHKYAALYSAGKNRLFGRQKPLHLVLGGGNSADIILWRNKKKAWSIFVGVTVIWVLFECIGYHFLTFLSHSLILFFSLLFLWSNLASFFNLTPPEFPEVSVPEEVLVTVLLWVRAQINVAVTTIHDVASGKDLKKFLTVVLALWVVSVVGSWFSFLTLFYLVFVMLQTVPMLYEKHEDTVDTYAEKGWIEVKKQYAVLDEKFLQKVPIFTSQKDHKQN